MTKGYVSVVGVVVAVVLAAPGVVLADVSDDFNDYVFSRFPSYGADPWVFGGDDPNYDPRLPGYDPNLWEPNNPDWTIQALTGESYAADANSGLLRLYVQGIWGFGFIGAECYDGDDDPNTSTTWFDDSAPHYLLARGQIAAYPFLGMIGVWMNFDPVTWTSYAYEYEPANGWMSITAYNGLDYDGHVTDDRFWCVVKLEYAYPDLDPNHGDANYFDPNRPSDANYVVDPNYLNDDFHPVHPDPNGFYMLLQFDPYGFHQYGLAVDANDPNCHWLRAAFWNDGEEWDGEWHMQCCLWNTSWDDPNDGWYFTDGTTAFASFTGGDPWELGPYSDVAYDNYEAKWGYYGEKFPNVTLTLTNCKDCDTYILYPNNPHPQGGNKRQYVKGTVISLAMDCKGNKVFTKWKIWGPNDPNLVVINKDDEVLILTMSGDYTVKGWCKASCGGSIEPFAAMVLVVLGLAVIIRRLR